MFTSDRQSRQQRETILRAGFALAPSALAEVYSSQALERIGAKAEVSSSNLDADNWRSHVEVLREVDVLFSGWGSALVDKDFLHHAPRLKAVFYAAGSVRHFTTPEFWQRKIRLTSAYAINAIPVAEYTIGAILLGLKHVWHYSRITRERRNFPLHRPVVGGFRSKIGLVSYGTIARLVRERLRPFDMEVLVYDPFLSKEEAISEGVEPVELDELFARADVVSVHAPAVGSTHRMIGAVHFQGMKKNATFINTARGEVIREDELVSFLQSRPDVQAVLDVTDPEPPERNSPLYTLPNVVLTPHVAGSLGTECFRMGDAMADEFDRYLAGQPLLWELNEKKVARMA